MALQATNVVAVGSQQAGQPFGQPAALSSGLLLRAVRRVERLVVCGFVRRVVPMPKAARPRHRIGSLLHASMKPPALAAVRGETVVAVAG